MLKLFPEGVTEHNGPAWAIRRNVFFYWRGKTVKFAFEGPQCTVYGNHHGMNRDGREILAQLPRLRVKAKFWRFQLWPTDAEVSEAANNGTLGFLKMARRQGLHSVSSSQAEHPGLPTPSVPSMLEKDWLLNLLGFPITRRSSLEAILVSQAVQKSILIKYTGL